MRLLAAVLAALLLTACGVYGAEEPDAVGAPESVASDAPEALAGGVEEFEPVKGEDPPGLLPKLTYRAIPAPDVFLDAVAAMTEAEFWEREPPVTMYQFPLVYTGLGEFSLAAESEPYGPSAIAVYRGEERSVVFAANQPIGAMYWLDRTTLVLMMIDGIYYGDRGEAYYLLDLATGVLGESELSYPAVERGYPELTALFDRNVWHRGQRYFFPLSPHPEGPEQKHVFVEKHWTEKELWTKEGWSEEELQELEELLGEEELWGEERGRTGFVPLAEDVWSWAFAGGHFYYKNDESGNVYGLGPQDGEPRIVYTTENPYETVDVERIAGL